MNTEIEEINSTLPAHPVGKAITQKTKVIEFAEKIVNSQLGEITGAFIDTNTMNLCLKYSSTKTSLTAKTNNKKEDILTPIFLKAKGKNIQDYTFNVILNSSDDSTKIRTDAALIEHGVLYAIESKFCETISEKKIIDLLNELRTKHLKSFYTTLKDAKLYLNLVQQNYMPVTDIIMTDKIIENPILLEAYADEAYISEMDILDILEKFGHYMRSFKMKLKDGVEINDDIFDDELKMVKPQFVEFEYISDHLYNLFDIEIAARIDTSSTEPISAITHMKLEKAFEMIGQNGNVEDGLGNNRAKKKWNDPARIGLFYDQLNTYIDEMESKTFNHHARHDTYVTSTKQRTLLYRHFEEHTTKEFKRDKVSGDLKEIEVKSIAPSKTKLIVSSGNITVANSQHLVENRLLIKQLAYYFIETSIYGKFHYNPWERDELVKEVYDYNKGLIDKILDKFKEHFISKKYKDTDRAVIKEMIEKWGDDRIPVRFVTEEGDIINQFITSSNTGLSATKNQEILAPYKTEQNTIRSIIADYQIDNKNISLALTHSDIRKISAKLNYNENIITIVNLITDNPLYWDDKQKNSKINSMNTVDCTYTVSLTKKMAKSFAQLFIKGDDELQDKLVTYEELRDEELAKDDYNELIIKSFENSIADLKSQLEGHYSQHRLFHLKKYAHLQLEAIIKVINVFEKVYKMDQYNERMRNLTIAGNDNTVLVSEHDYTKGRLVGLFFNALKIVKTKKANYWHDEDEMIRYFKLFIETLEDVRLLYRNINGEFVTVTKLFKDTIYPKNIDTTDSDIVLSTFKVSVSDLTDNIIKVFKARIINDNQNNV